MAVRGIPRKAGSFVRSEIKSAIYNNKDQIRQAFDIGRGERHGWNINDNKKAMFPSFSLERYMWHYFFGKRPEWYDDEQGEPK